MTEVPEPTGIHDNTFQGAAPINTGTGNQNNTYVISASERARVVAGLPAEPAGFVGRDAQIRELLAVLEPGTTTAEEPGTVVVCAVGGLGGVGKTALALYAAHRAVRLGWFAGAVVVDLHGYGDPAARLDASGVVPVLLRALGVDREQIPVTVPEQVAYYQWVLGELAGQGRRVLVVLDNVSDSAQVAGLLPGDDCHRVVVTSRHTLGSLGARLLDLDVLGPEESVALLARALRDARPQDERAGQQAELAQLAGVCGRLALALQIAAALLIVFPHRTIASLTAQLADERARLEYLVFPDSALKPGVRAAFEVSTQQLTEPQARMFRLLTIDPGPDVSTEAAAVLADLPEAETQGLLFALEAAHLITCSPGERWGMHDLVRLYARDLLKTAAEGEQLQARERLLEYYLATTNAADDHLRVLTGRVAPDRFGGRAQALEWLDANRANLVAAVALAADHDRPDIALNLPLCLAEFFSWRRLFDDWIETSAIARHAARTRSDRSSEGMALNNLGVALRQASRFDEAINAHQQAAKIYRETNDRHLEGEALNNLGGALVRVRRFDQAIDTLRQAVEIYRETNDRHREGMALNNLGLALREVHRFDEAIDAHQQAAKIHRETNDRHGEGMALNNLGIALVKVHRFDEAIDAYQQSLAICRELDDRYGEAQTLENLGIVLLATHRSDECRELWHQALEIYTSLNEHDDAHDAQAWLAELDSPS
jgi:tetratricopeptide (TPR) repeat protein